jgi:hypothetical protein
LVLVVDASFWRVGEKPLRFRVDGIHNMSQLTYPAVVTTRYRLDTRDKQALLFAMMSTFASERTLIVFEGNLANTELFKLEGASYEETAKLKRATTSPKLDFIVLPLTATRLPAIEKAIRSKVAFAGNRGIIHVQIEAKDVIVFGAYDNFGRESVVVNGTIPTNLLDELVKDRTLRSYTPIPEK